jgi:uncharacterized protein (UPF0332 family)
MDTWYDVATDSRKAANELVRSRYRSCLSRAYYAAYAKVTHLLVQKGEAMPDGREGPPHPGHLPTGEAKHKGIRQLIMEKLTEIDVAKRRALSELIGELYTLRLYGDYRPSQQIDAVEAREAVSMMNTVFENF